MKPFVPLLIVLMLVSTSFVGVSYTADKTSPISFDGNTLYVGGSGEGNYTRIQDAIDNSSDGDTVFVYNGTYYGNISVNKSIKLIGEDNNATILEKLVEDSYGYVRIYADFVNILDFTLKGLTIDIDDCCNISIVNNIFKDCRSCMWFSGSHNNSILNNVINKSSYYGILLYGCHNNIVDGNIINNTRRNSIDVSGDNNTISNNIITNSKTGGIELGGEDNVCFGNTIMYNDEGFDFWWGSRNFIYNNNLTDNNVGLTYGGGVLNNISNNIFSNNKEFGIDFVYFQIDYRNNVFWNNTFYGNGGNIIWENNTIIGNSFINDGIEIRSGCNVKNNTVNGKPLVYIDGESDIEIKDDAGAIILTKCDNITVRNQDLSNTYTGIILRGSNNCLISNNNISSNNHNGIELVFSNNNIISNNNIKENFIGVELVTSSRNKIISNNFKGNEKNAWFWFLSFLNRWWGNYWDRPRIFPYPVNGYIIPRFNFDWRPAFRPNDVGV